MGSMGKVVTKQTFYDRISIFICFDNITLQAGAEAEVSTPLEIRDLRFEIRENLKSEI